MRHRLGAGLLVVAVGLAATAPAGAGAVAPSPARVPTVAAPDGRVSAQADQPSGEERLVAAWYRTFLGRDGTTEEVAAGAARLGAGATRSSVLTPLALSDGALGRHADELYRTFLGRTADAAGRQYWVERLRAGAAPSTRLEAVVAPFAASPESYARAGGTPEGYVDRLYQVVLGRAAEEGGRAYWVDALASRPRSHLVTSLLATPEARARRVAGLYSWVLGRSADTTGVAYWRDQLAATNDIRVAIRLALSAEYVDRAVTVAPPEVPEPVATTIPCPSGVPSHSRVSCHTVTVAADRADFDGVTIDLFAVVVAGTATPRHPDPVVYLSGGPGQTAVTSGRVNRYLTTDPTGGRDVVLFDQRGTGRSGPDLTCPEVTDGTFDLLTTPTPRHEVALDLAAEAFGACHDRLVAAGTDLSVFNTEIAADDAVEVGQALGYEQLNLFGVSYGTTVALAAIRRHPDRLRGVVLDSVLTTTSPDTAENLAERYFRGRQAIIDGCAASPACAARYPNLPELYDQVVARYDATPHATAATDAHGNPITVRITGADVVAGLFQAQYDASFVPVLPWAVEQLAQGNTGLIDVLVSQGIDFWFGLSAGLAASVQCADRQRHTVGSDPEAVVAEHPELALFLVAAALLDHCERWEVPSVSEGFDQPVTGDVPTFVLSGTFDPITPPAYGEEAAAALSHATHVVIPDGGHGQVFTTSCATSLFTAFLSDPATPLDTSCVDAIAPPAWLV